MVTLLATLEAKDLPAVEQAVLAEITRIQEQGVTEEERQLAVTRAEAQYAFDRETTEGLAFAYGIAELTWSLDEELRYIDSLRGVTREQIQEAARRWLPTTSYARIAFAARKMGGLERAPQAPRARHAPGYPGRSSILRQAPGKAAAP